MAAQLGAITQMPGIIERRTRPGDRDGARRAFDSTFPCYA